MALYISVQAQMMAQQNRGEPLPLKKAGIPVPYHLALAALWAYAPDDSSKLPFMLRGKKIRKDAWAIAMIMAIEEKGLIATNLSDQPITFTDQATETQVDT